MGGGGGQAASCQINNPRVDPAGGGKALVNEVPTFKRKKRRDR